MVDLSGNGKWLGIEAVFYTRLFCKRRRIAAAAALLVMVNGASALFGDSERDLAVMVFEAAGDEDHGTVRLQKVNATPLASGTDFIVSGLDIGTLVVAAGASLLDEGQRVRRFQGFDE